MKNAMKAIFGLALLCTHMTTALLVADDTITCDHQTNHTTNNYFGVAQLRLPFVVADDFAVAFLGEVGPKSWRVNGTAGAIYDCHQIKFGAEYLAQKFNYNFLTGRVEKWVNQYAVGGRYQYMFNCGWINSLYFDASSAYAGNHSFSPLDCVTTLTTTTVDRRLAGSRYFDAEVGIQVAPWSCGLFSVGVGYNNLRYDKELECGDRSFKGISGSAAFNQRLTENLGLNIDAQFRRAYNYAEAMIDWQCETGCGMLSLGLFGGYVWGKTDLPSSTTFGVEIGFVFGPDSNNCYPADFCCSTPCSNPCQDLIAWVSTPGVYIPTVLVTAEELVTTVSNCTPVSIVSTIPNQPSSSSTTQTLPVSNFFSSSSPITYSVTSVQLNPVTPAPWTVSVNQAGVITASVPNNFLAQTTVQITVTASNGCNSQSQTFTMSFGSF